MEDTTKARQSQRDETVPPIKQIVGDKEVEEEEEEERGLAYERSRLEAVNKYRAEALQKRMDLIATQKEKEKETAKQAATETKK